MRILLGRSALIALLALACGARAQPGERVRLGGKEFVRGEVYLESPADTVALLAAGFRDFEFLGRSVGTVRYSVLWPADLDPGALALKITVVSYTAPTVAHEFEWLGGYPQPAPGARMVTLAEQLEIENAKQAWEAGRTKRGGLSMTNEEVERYRDPEARKEALWGKGSGPKVRQDPRTTGSFISQPVEDGPFHKVRNVTSQDPHLTGNFQLPSTHPTAGLTLRSYEEMRPDFPLPNTGTFLTSPASGERPEWQSIGVRSPHWPVIETPEAYRGSIGVPRGRGDRGR